MVSSVQRRKASYSNKVNDSVVLPEVTHVHSLKPLALQLANLTRQHAGGTIYVTHHMLKINRRQNYKILFVNVSTPCREKLRPKKRGN